jgi:hypothetical protein
MLSFLIGIGLTPLDEIIDPLQVATSLPRPVALCRVEGAGGLIFILLAIQER